MREKTIFKNTDGMLVAWSPYFMTELSRGRQYFVEIVSFFLSLCWYSFVIKLFLYNSVILLQRFSNKIKVLLNGNNFPFFKAVASVKNPLELDLLVPLAHMHLLWNKMHMKCSLHWSLTTSCTLSLHNNVHITLITYMFNRVNYCTFS